MIIALKITLIFQASFVFYLLGKYGKIISSARNIFFVIANGGCLFLASGLIMNNIFLIKGGIFILIIQALLDGHQIILKYIFFKSSENEEKETSEKK